VTSPSEEIRFKQLVTALRRGGRKAMEYEEKIKGILKSSLAIGHKIQDILEVYGMENRQARGAARAVAVAVEQHLTTLGNTFTENGQSECGRALLFEAKNLFSS
jgi:hypothetical protein